MCVFHVSKKLVLGILLLFWQAFSCTLVKNLPPNHQLKRSQYVQHISFDGFWLLFIKVSVWFDYLYRSQSVWYILTKDIGYPTCNSDAVCPRKKTVPSHSNNLWGVNSATANHVMLHVTSNINGYQRLREIYCFDLREAQARKPKLECQLQWDSIV